MYNKQRITLVAFLAYFVLSGMLAPIGIISGPMAELFNRPVTEITRQFSWLTGGNLIGAVISLFIFDWIPLRRVLLAIYGAIALGLLTLGLLDSLAYGRLVLGLVGLGNGIGLAGAALTISRTYEAEQRASLLVITDGCFSVAGFVCAGLASYFVALGLGWSSTYQIVGLIAAIIFGLTLASRFPATTRMETGASHNEPWPLSVWLCVVALFLYTLGQYSMLFWLPNYVSERLGASPAVAGSLIGQFWLGMFLAQMFVAWWVFRIGLQRLVLIAAVTTVLGSIPLWTVTDPGVLQICALAWGLANLSMLKALLSLATTMVKVPDPRLVSCLLLGATLGTAISPALTSLVVEWSDNRTVLMFSTGCYAALLVIVLIAKHRHQQNLRSLSTLHPDPE